MSQIEQLTAARALIAKGWAQGAQARDQHGNHTEPRDRNAVCWCVYGALQAVLAHDDSTNALRSTAGTPALADWNDRPYRTQGHVLKLFDDTIARLTKEVAQ